MPMTAPDIKGGRDRPAQRIRYRAYWRDVFQKKQAMRWRWTAPGRTDGGVHARGQTASVVLRGLAEDGFFLKQVNGILPPDIRILEAALVKNGFHARKSAVGKVYEYYIDTGERPDVFTRRYCFHYPRKLDLSAMRTAAGCLIGTHEFAGYTDKKEEKSTKRTIYAIIVSGQGSRVKIRYEGTGFLYHMVRILTGTLIEAGTGERRPRARQMR